MREYIEQQPRTKEEHEETGMLIWLADSHYWIKDKYDSLYCKWCGQITTTYLKGDATLCKENPAIKKAIKTPLKKTN